MKTEVDIRNATTGLPKKTLDELYEEGFIRILTSGQRSQSCAIQVFSLLPCTQEALSPEAVIQTLSRAYSHQEESMTLTKMINKLLRLGCS